MGQSLPSDGAAIVYMRAEDEPAYRAYVQANLNALLHDPVLDPAALSRIIYEAAVWTMEDVLADPSRREGLDRAAEMVEAMVPVISGSAAGLWQLIGAASLRYRTFSHCVKVCALLIGAARSLLGITDARALCQIGLGGIFHDIGKSRIPAEILSKPAKLTAEEFEKVKEHPGAGLELLAGYERVRTPAMQIVRSHHERLDGSGYPDGLAGEAVSLEARLAAVIDVYDALTTQRCYAPARTSFAAISMMLEEMPGQFDGPLLRSFVEFLGPRRLKTAPA
jgi:HD-GYP domain-containing protein (c-di-GMP phosphodiesterase class II)